MFSLHRDPHTHLLSSPTGLIREKVPAESIADILRHEHGKLFAIAWDVLPERLAARVERRGGKERVVLEYQGKETTLKRDRADDPGDLCVTCSPEGESVPVETINICFAPHDPESHQSRYTDRSLVWITPNFSKAAAHLVVTKEATAVQVVPLIKEIIEMAQAAIEEQLLRHIQ